MSISCWTGPWYTQQRIVLISYMVSLMNHWLKIMVSVLWSRDLNPCDFYFWCMPTHKVSVNNSLSSQKLKENIWQEILAPAREHAIFSEGVRPAQSIRLALWLCCKVSYKSGGNGPGNVCNFCAVIQEGWYVLWKPNLCFINMYRNLYFAWN